MVVAAAGRAAGFLLLLRRKDRAGVTALAAGPLLAATLSSAIAVFFAFLFSWRSTASKYLGHFLKLAGWPMSPQLTQ